MSIIYDALKKTETKTKDIEEKIRGPKRNKSKFLKIFFVLCILIIVGFAGFFIGKPSKSPSSGRRGVLIPKIRLPTSVQTKASKESKSTLSLNGIMFSDGQYFALINDQIVKAGDFIEGAQIHKIDSAGVEITTEESSYRLSYP